jgi:pyruvate dehydrogenase E1 component
MKVPPLDTFKAVLEPTAEGREISTTQAYVRFLTALLRDKELGPRAVPILVDEGPHLRHGRAVPPDRHLQPRGQLYTPQDKDQVSYYKEDKAGPDPAGRHQRGRRHGQLDRRRRPSYSTSNRIMVPFYVLLLDVRASSASATCAGRPGDMQARGFLLGGTSGRTDAQRRRPAARGRPQPHPGGHHSQLRELRPDFRHEVAWGSCSHGLKRMVEKQEKRLLLPDAAQRELPMPGCSRHRRADHQGHVPVKAGARHGPRRRACKLRAAAPSCAKAIAAQEMLEKEWGVAANVWSCPSFNE